VLDLEIVQIDGNAVQAAPFHKRQLEAFAQSFKTVGVGQRFDRVEKLVIGIIAHKKGAVIIRGLGVIEIQAVILKVVAGQNAHHDHIVLELLYQIFVLQPFLNGAKAARRAEVQHFLACGCFQQVGKSVFGLVAPAFNERIAQQRDTRLI
jgi:hypothetical protein